MAVLMHGLDGSIEYLRLGGKNAIIMEIKGGNHSDKTKFTRGIYDADSDSD